jgi:hypothetical protein
VLSIDREDQRFVEEDLLGLPEPNPMAFPILLDVSIVPVKTDAALQRVVARHPASISQRYTFLTALHVMEELANVTE